MVANVSADELREAEYLMTTAAIRERAERLYALGLAGRLAHFAIDESRIDGVARRVIEVTERAYGGFRAVPYHARFRHFAAGGVDRLRSLDAALAAKSREEQLASRFELVITSVLLDAGAGERWRYQEPGGASYTRSEGLAVASYRLFASGGLAAEPPMDPLRADASRLARFSEAELGRAFQVSDDNPLVGLAGRAEVLRRLGDVVTRKPQHFGSSEPRLGGLGLSLAARAVNGALPATAVLGAVLDALGEIWPGRETCGDRNLGDVWRHSAVGRVPFHKLSQWLTYSLCEPLEAYGVEIVELDGLTGLAEYRNGGLFVDAGVLVPKHAAVCGDVHPVSSEPIVEWRALTIALLDRTAEAVRELVGLDAVALPLAKVLEGGTWAAGRALASEARPGGAPPIRVQSDGTVF